jgi:hypothetical protein
MQLTFLALLLAPVAVHSCWRCRHPLASGVARHPRPGALTYICARTG